MHWQSEALGPGWVGRVLWGLGGGGFEGLGFRVAVRGEGKRVGVQSGFGGLKGSELFLEIGPSAWEFRVYRATMPREP